MTVEGVVVTIGIKVVVGVTGIGVGHHEDVVV